MNLGVIGLGNLGNSFVKGIISNQAIGKENIFVVEKSEEKRDYAQRELGVNVYNDASEVVNIADVVILAVKPYQIEELLKDVSVYDLKGKVFISFAAGTSIEKLRKNLHKEAALFRAMPNISIMTGDGLTGISGENGQKLPQEIADLFRTLGTVIEMDENDLDKVMALSACGLAYVAEFMQAFIETGLSFGMPRDIVDKIAAQTFIGTAKTLIYEDITPNDFISMVATPGGATEQGIVALRDKEVKQTIIDAIMASYNKAFKLS